LIRFDDAEVARVVRRVWPVEAAAGLRDLVRADGENLPVIGACGVADLPRQIGGSQRGAVYAYCIPISSIVGVSNGCPKRIETVRRTEASIAALSSAFRNASARGKVSRTSCPVVTRLSISSRSMSFSARQAHSRISRFFDLAM